MNPQQLSNSLWALKDFVDASPAVTKAVQALVEKVPSKISAMNGQDISNILQALVYLEESFPIPELHAIVTAAVMHLHRILPEQKGKGLMLDVPIPWWSGPAASATSTMQGCSRQWRNGSHPREPSPQFLTGDFVPCDLVKQRFEPTGANMVYRHAA